MSLQIRRGTDAERLTITPLTAELIYTTDTQLVYVGDGVTVGGILVGDGGGNGTYGNANVVALLGSGVAGDILPVGNSVYSLGSPTTQWKDLYISNNTIYINNVPLSANGNVITYDGVPLVSTNSNENISTSGNISGGNLILELSGAIVFPDGSTQTTAAQPYTDADVEAYLAGGTDTSNIITTGNISGAYFIGNGSQLTGLPSGYSNAEVATFLASGTDTQNIVTTANVQASHIIGNGAALTALTGANVTGEVNFAATANAVAGANVSGEVAHAAVANSVAGANVVGTVASATVAASANAVAGANVSGEVGFAATANAVAGANVSGEVAHAAVANSVAGANVSGEVAFAGTANLVAGANVSGTVASATVAASANAVAGANVSGQVAHAAVANSVAGANVVGTVATATTAETVTTAAQPNITSVGTLTGLSVSGNINAGGQYITNLAEPTTANEAATKGYVDARASGLSVKGSVALATVAPLSLAYSYDNGASGVGAYILGTSVGQLFIDGVAVTVGSRVLIKNEVGAYVDDNTPSAAFNGIYVVLDDGVSNAFQLERATDCDTAAEIPSAYTLVTGGTLVNTGWVDNNVAGMTVGTTSIVFVQFSSVSSYTGGSAIDVTGTVISALYDGSTIVTNGSNQLEVGTVPGTSISGTVASATVAASANSVAGANVSGEVAFAAVANSVAGANVSGAVSLADYATTANAVAGANVSGEVAFAATANLVAGANVSGEVGFAAVANSVAGANVSGEVAHAAIANSVAGANVSGEVAFAATANSVAGANVSGEVAFAATANSVAGANVSGQVANALVAGTVYEASQPNITSVGTLTTLEVTGNITGDYFIGNGSQLTGLPAGYANSDVANYLASNSNVVITTTGNITTTANIEAGFFIGDGSQLTNLPPVPALSIPAVYFNVVADGNNQTFSNTVLSAYTSNTEITLFYNGALLDSPYYTLSGDTLTINTELFTGDSIDVIRQFASNVIVSTYSNSDVSAYLASGNDTANIITTGNISGAYFIGNGSQLTGLPAGYSNADVSTYLASGTDTAGISTAGNITAQAGAFFIGDGGLLSNISGTGNYSNANVANYLPTYSGELSAGNIGVSGNISAVGEITSFANVVAAPGAFFIGDGGLLSNISGGGSYSNADVANYLASNANVVVNTTGNITSTANVEAAYFIGDGSQLTNLPAGDYSNANVANYLPTYTGDLANVNMANTLGLLMGTPTQGSLVSNAVTLTTTTALTNGIALLNNVLGKLVPPSPPAFPASQTLSVSGLATYRMANTSQVDNIPSGGHTVAGGATVTTVKRTAAYATNTITTAGPGDTGTVTALRNEAAAGSVTLTGSSNGTYGNLIITNNQDYNLSNSSIAAGFWYVFSSQLSGTVPAGWNSAQITDTAAGSTNTVVWYYDASAPGTPAFSSVTMTPPGSPTVIYSSTVPHYTNVNQFNIGFTANRLSGDMYPTSDTFATGTAGGAFAAPASRTYQLSSLGTNVLTPNASASVTTTATVISGFGSSSTGPSISVVNSYATGTQTLTAALGNTVLYKTGTSSSMEETNITIGSPIGSGSGAAYRIDNPGSGDTPVFTGSEGAFNSQTGPLQTDDATIVAAILKHDQTNYSTGYLPAGPDLSVGRSGAQYFTFKFVRTATSKFDVKFSGTIAGMWIALPGSVIDTASTLNGWIDASVNYAGSGVPGANIAGGGNGSNGCGLGSTAPLNTLSTNVSTTCTFGTASSSSTATNEIYVRIKLTAGQTVTALSLQTGSR